MDPVFLQIGNFTIAWYGVLITLGIVLGLLVGTRLARQRGLNVDLFNDMVLWAIIWGLVGARIVFVATSWEQFAGTPMPRLLLDVINLRIGWFSEDPLAAEEDILRAMWLSPRDCTEVVRCAIEADFSQSIAEHDTTGGSDASSSQACLWLCLS